MLTITEQATNKIRAQLSNENMDPAEYGLRIGVQAGGCSGLSYIMKWDKPGENDQVYGEDDAKVIVDTNSIQFVDGSVLEYVDALTGAGFTVVNPNATGTCGCGESFSV
jgi:iron-sulfur cluster assembly protein